METYGLETKIDNHKFEVPEFAFRVSNSMAINCRFTTEAQILNYCIHKNFKKTKLSIILGVLVCGLADHILSEFA